MDCVSTGLRTQDFHESLRIVAAFGPRDVHFKNTLLIGKAATLAMHLKGLLYVDDITQLEYAAASLGISSLELPTVLRELEVLDFVSVVSSGEAIKRVDIRIPEFRSGYNDLGQRWLDRHPGEIEQAGLATLNDLYNGPRALTELRRILGLPNASFAALNDVMKSGQLLSVQTVDGEPIAFTPLAVDGNPTVYLEWAKKFPGDVQRVIADLQASQGAPVQMTALSSDGALRAAIDTGVLLPVQVNGATGPQRFAFAPCGGLHDAERSILDKARAILACVRYGQNFAAGRPIKYPRRILETLRDRHRFKQGHPDLFMQYGILVEKLIGHPIDEGGGRWNFQFDDTPENVKALNVALEMLEHGQTPSARIDLEAQKALLAPTSYCGPAATRPKLALDPELSSDTRAEIIRQMAKLARGMGH